MALLNVKSGQKAKDKDTDNTQPELITCKKCKRKYKKGVPYYKACQHCHPGGDKHCYKLYPELSPRWKSDPTSKTIKTNKPTKPSTDASSAALTWNIGAKTDCTGVNMVAIDWNYQQPTDSLFALINNQGLTKDSVIINSSASHYTFNNEKWFTKKYNLNTLYCAASANGGSAMAYMGSKVYIDVKRSDRSHSSINIINIVLCKTSPVNILSQGQLYKAGAMVDGLNNKLIL